MAHKELKYDEDARRALEAGVNTVANAVKVTLGPIGLKRGVESAVETVVEHLRGLSKEVSGKDQIARVAAISAGDDEIGNVIADAIDKVGKDGVVNVEEGQTFGMELEFTEGMQFDKGYISPYMVTDQERMEAVLEDPYILIANQKIGSVRDLLPVLGHARRVVVSKDTSTVIDGAGEKQQIEGRINQIRAEIDTTDSDFDREKLQERLAKLAGGVAVVKVGAATETEMKEKKHRVEDALQATRAALEEGIVPGGGVALLNAQDAIDPSALGTDEATGAEIIRRSLEEPLRQIAQNSGLEGSV